MEEEWTQYDGGAVQEWHRGASRIRVATDVAVIPEGAFEECEQLVAVDLRNVTTISDDAFNGCDSLERVVWSTAPAVEIGKQAFARCDRLGEIDLGNTTKIGPGAFFGCGSLTRVAIPSSLVEVEKFAFDGCRNLAGVDIGEGLHRIGEGAFRYCFSLVRIAIPTSVTAIEDGAFCNCSNLTEVELNEGLQRIGGWAFNNCSPLSSISIPSTTTEVGEFAFQGCNQLMYAELQEGLRVVGAGAFKSCRSLERITIPSSVESSGTGAFADNPLLSEVALREGIHDIATDAFHNCPILEHIDIPPVAFVIDIYRSSCQLGRTLIPAVERGEAGLRRRLVVSKWMQYRSPEQLEQAEEKVNEIMNRRQTEGQKITLIREWFAYLDWLDVTTMLELAIWKANLDANARDADGRQRCRRNCGNDMSVIIPGALLFLEG